MAQNFREIVRDDKTFQQLLRIAENHSQDEYGVISINDFNRTCAKVTTSIHTTNPNTYTRRVAWTLTGRLLLGLTMYHNIRVQICYEESLKLLQQTGRQMIILEKTKTTKRKIKQVVTEKQSKNKRKRTVEVEEEVENVERYHFWEVPLQLDKNENTAPDLCLVPAEQITLRDIDEPLSSSKFDDAEMGNGFGEEEPANVFDEDEEMASFMAHSFENDSKGIAIRQSSFDLDENMNDIASVDNDLSNILSEIKDTRGTNRRPSENRSRPETPVKLLIAGMPLSPPAAAAPKKIRRKRRHFVFKDMEKTISDEMFLKRIANIHVDCKSAKSGRVTGMKWLKLQLPHDMATSVMNGTANREPFMRNAKILFDRQVETDWDIIHDAFGSTSKQSNGTVEPTDVDLLRNESVHPYDTRSFNQMSSCPYLPMLTSTPIKQSQNCSQFNAPRARENRAETMQLIELDASEENLFTPPSNFQDNVIAPAPGFESIQINFEPPKPTHRSHSPQSNVDIVPSNNDIEYPQITCSDLDSVLGDDSLDLDTMKKLLNLWQKNVHPITVQNLLTSRSNRLQAAKTFGSLLMLKKKKLVQLENSVDGKIVHISKGCDLNIVD